MLFVNFIDLISLTRSFLVSQRRWAFLGLYLLILLTIKLVCLKFLYVWSVLLTPRLQWSLTGDQRVWRELINFMSFLFFLQFLEVMRAQAIINILQSQIDGLLKEKWGFEESISRCIMAIIYLLLLSYFFLNTLVFWFCIDVMAAINKKPV